MRYPASYRVFDVRPYTGTRNRFWAFLGLVRSGAFCRSPLFRHDVFLGGSPIERLVPSPGPGRGTGLGHDRDYNFAEGGGGVFNKSEPYLYKKRSCLPYHVFGMKRVDNLSQIVTCHDLTHCKVDTISIQKID